MGQQNALVVSAHAADFCSRSGGVIAKLASKGWRVHVIDLTMGERGESEHFWKTHPDATVEMCKQARRVEAEAAAQVLGCSIEFADFDDYPLIITPDRLKWLAGKIRSLRPRLVLTHWDYDPTNPDHHETSAAVIRAIASATVAGFDPRTPKAGMPEVFMFESTIPVTEFNRFEPDTYVDVTSTYAQKLDALRKFVSQPFLPEWYTQYARYRAHQARTWSGRPDIEYAEAFKRYTPRVCHDILPDEGD